MPAAVPDAKVPPQNLDVRGYYSLRFHVQSFGHVFQVLIKLPRIKNKCTFTNNQRLFLDYST